MLAANKSCDYHVTVHKFYWLIRPHDYMNYCTVPVIVLLLSFYCLQPCRKQQL